MSERSSVERDLGYCIDLQLPGFRNAVPPGTVKQFSYFECHAEAWFDSFYDELNRAMGKHFLPVYRMADGEFIFCVGRRRDLSPLHASPLKRLYQGLRSAASVCRQRLAARESTCWGESYDGVSKSELMDHYVRCLRAVAAKGKLAVHLTRSEGRFSEQYIGPMLDFFEKHAIPFCSDNYTSFYFVYALLCGPRARDFVRGRTILIVTSADEGKRQRIEASLLSLGARAVKFLGISPNRSMLDRLDLEGLGERIDLVFVAAGIGSANILAQLEPLSTVCLDIGACMEILADDARRGRIFTVMD